MRSKIFLFCLGLILFSNFISSDIISINSGGDTGMVINSDNYIEGFFGCIPTTCSKLGYTCDEWSDECGKILSCGSCPVGFACSSGTCIVSTEGGTGGGGGGGESTGIVISPTSINLTLSFNNQTNMGQRVSQKIYITNNGGSSQTFLVTQTGLSEVAILGTTSITVAPGQTGEVYVDFVSPLVAQDIIGAIFIGGYKIPTYIHVTSNPLWFDSNIIVLNENYQVARGATLKTRVELVPMGEKSRLDVTLNYVIKDASGKIYLTKSETVLVSDRTNFNRDFGTGMLPVGNYVIGLEVVYPGGVAPSSAHFEVIKMNVGSLFGTILFFIILGILIIGIIILILLIRRKKKEKESSQ